MLGGIETNYSCDKPCNVVLVVYWLSCLSDYAVGINYSCGQEHRIFLNVLRNMVANKYTGSKLWLDCQTLIGFCLLL